MSPDIAYLELGRMGRLGNALFELASTIGLAHRNQTMPRFNADWIHRWAFSVPDEFFNPPPGPVVNATDLVPHIDPRAAAFLQDVSLFADILPTIREYLQPSPAARGVLADHSGAFDLLPHPILSIHVRRTDKIPYGQGGPDRAEDGNYHRCAPLAYYEKAMEILMPDAASIAIFSDAPDWVREQPSLVVNADYIHDGAVALKEHEPGFAESTPMDWIDLQLMARCQPAGTLVRTRDGDRPIESIVVGDQVMSYCRRPGERRLIGRVPIPNRSCDLDGCGDPVDARGLCSKHYQRAWGKVKNKDKRVEIPSTWRRGKVGHPSGRRVTATTRRHFDGDLVTAKSSAGMTRYTPEHPCIVRIGNELFAKHLVYLMRRGRQFRVGTTHPRVLSSDPRRRMRQEAGDALWLLAAFDGKAEALIEEKLVSARFGVPEVRFRRGSSERRNPMPDQMVPEMFWERFGDNVENGMRCLDAYGREVAHPFFSLDRRKHSYMIGHELTIEACNVMDGMLMLDADAYVALGDGIDDCPAAWTPVSVGREPYVGEVYSLEVAHTHTYVADGIVTHNCDLSIVTGSTYGIFGALLADSKRVIHPRRVYQRNLSFINEDLLWSPEWEVVDL